MDVALRNQEKNFYDLFSEIIFEIDKNLNIKFLNKSCERILGFDKDDYINKSIPIQDFFVPTDLKRIKESIAKNFNGILVSGNTYRVYDKDSNEIPLMIKKYHHNQNGGANVLKCIAKTVTDEKTNDKENKYFKNVFKNLPIPYQSLDANCKITNVNPEWVKRLGYSLEEVIGKDFKTFISKNYKDKFDTIFHDYKKTGEINNLRINLVHKNGKDISVIYTGKIEDKGNSLKLRTHCVFNDITEQNAIEKSLKESEKKFRELNATKDKFFSIIAHDLKNPFNDLMGFTQLLGLNIDKYDKNKIKEFVDIIYQSSKLAYNLLENLLNWSRSQTGNLKFNPEKILINNLVNENINLLISNAQKKNIQIFSELDKNIYAYADRNMIMTVIRNLISNAIKYTQQGGYINISSYCSRKCCEISIQDNGIGIEKNNLNKIFKIEEGFSTVGTEREKGTGLGLILCREFVEKNKGKIWVKSEPGKGSTFTFALPLPEPEFLESGI